MVGGLIVLRRVLNTFGESVMFPR